MIDKALEEQYNARAAVPGHQQIFSRWKARSESCRAASKCSLDIRYGGGARETLDLFHGKGDRLHLFLHGGYWQAMDKSFFSFLATGLVQRGRDVAICNYPLAPDASLPQILDSVRRACLFLWRNADRFDAAWKSIQVSGHSAGGQLVAMLLTTRWPDLDPALPKGLVDSGIAVSGLYDLDPLRQTTINLKLGLDEASARRNSPLHLTPATQAPMLLVTGSEERPAFQQQMADFAENRRSFEVPVKTLCLPGLNHFTVVEELTRAEGALLDSVISL